MTDLMAVEIKKRLDDGITKPFFVGCDDGNSYVLKGLPSLSRKELIAEWICANLAKSANLPIPDFKLIYVEDALIKYVPHWRRDLSEGYAFGSLYIENSMPITYTQAIENINQTQQKLIYLFDRIINNTDRTLSSAGQGNVNIIFNVSALKAYLIDHNLAFAENCVSASFLEHVYNPRNRQWDYDFADRHANEHDLHNILQALDFSVNEIPDAWKLDDGEHQGYIDYITALIGRIADDNFWRDIV